LQTFVEIRLASSLTSQSVQVSDAELRIGKELNTIQQMMKDWFYTSALISVVFLMAVYAIGLFMLKSVYDLYKVSHDQTQDLISEKCSDNEDNYTNKELTHMKILSNDMNIEQSSSIEHCEETDNCDKENTFDETTETNPPILEDDISSYEIFTGKTYRHASTRK